jgi:hypothetical protein
VLTRMTKCGEEINIRWREKRECKGKIHGVSNKGDFGYVQRFAETFGYRKIVLDVLG